MTTRDSMSRRGDTVIVVEHNLDLIRCCDWVVDLGPDGGDAGGELLVEGPPEAVAACEGSWTGRFLREAGVEGAMSIAPAGEARGSRAR